MIARLTDTELDAHISAVEERTGAFLGPRMSKPGMRDRIRAILAAASPTPCESEDDWDDVVTLVALAWQICREQDRKHHEPPFHGTDGGWQ